MTTPTRLARTQAARTAWEPRAACKQSDPEKFHSDEPADQRRAQGVCRRCPVRSQCLTDVFDYEDRSTRWGVVGGLTTIQRRALYCEELLGSVLNVGKARELASPRWSRRMMALRSAGFSPQQMAAELLHDGVIASAATVRVAVWWSGGKGGVLPRRNPGDRRVVWELVRDECRPIVDRLKQAGASNRDVSAYLQVAYNALDEAIRAWKAQDEAAAAMVQGVSA
jgi:hypothetical protein